MHVLEKLKLPKNLLLGSISPTFLHAAFMGTVPTSTKRQSSHECLFVLLGSSSAKVACKTLMKLTPDGKGLTSSSKSFSNHFCGWWKNIFSFIVTISLASEPKFVRNQQL